MVEKMIDKIRAGIIGASGYTGYELIKILSKHPKTDLLVLNSESYGSRSVKELYPDFSGDQWFSDYSIDKINSMHLDVIFLAVPHTAAMQIVPRLDCKKIIDLSADYRFADPLEYEKVYCHEHKDKRTKAVYGLSEIFKKEIQTATIVANPGCYATGMILSGFPIANYADYIVYDCKSGWSGAGKNSAYANDTSILKDNLVAYKLTNHRHKYEVEQFIKTKMSFTPHVIDTFQGMMITAHILLKENLQVEKIKEIYKNFYKEAVFTKVIDATADLHAVQKTNNLIIGGFEKDENNQLVIVTVLDNLMKGASGQAVQNMNIMFGFDEDEGLK